ncbi:hypothetical protein GGI25_004574 [Coemansia spiralis]|uniref:Alpha/beta hydrolase fold-3 domain-containing protein n=1 Tax=Coemansia spiralis TaxID=417178 RepID=A0A9W8KWZ6_9FUNG|nr:hypothetical protein GGI25_004574 [Coemansia spiralis]
MLDHILGKPSANVRRIQVIVTALLTLLLIRRQRAPWGLRWLLSHWDGQKRVSVWKAILGWSTLLYLLRHTDDLLGLNAPEPLREYYSRSFYRTTWIFTALDAGFWTAMSVRPKPLRDILSLFFSLYYLVNTNRAVEKVRKVRALITVEHLRVSWNKGVDNPVLRLVRRLHSSKLGTRFVVEVPLSERSSDAALEPAKCLVLFAGAGFTKCRHVVLNYPGGGFVAMGPECHEDYLSRWAETTGAVVVSVDYAKAPEYPYPYAIDQCFSVYQELVRTNGRCIGLDGDAPLSVVLAGDSAGGNITASVMFRILESPEPLPMPLGIVFIYGNFNVDIRAWMTKDETQVLLGTHKLPNLSTESLADTRDHLHHTSPLAVTNKDDGYHKNKNRKRAVYLDDRVRVVKSTHTNIGYVPLAMTSSFTYFNDQILSPEMMRAMIIMYIGPNQRPDFRTDYYLSPIVAPDHLLERFPPVYFMCGEKDPMVDDTVLFAARISRAKTQQQQEQKVSGQADKEKENSSSGLSHLLGKKPEYHEYKGSRLYSRRHSQPKPTSFYIGSTDVSDDEDYHSSKHPLPKSLRMSNIKPSRFATTNNSSGPVIKVKLVAGMSHGFMQMYSLLPESKQVADTLGDWLTELLHGGHTITAYSRCASVVDHSAHGNSYGGTNEYYPDTLEPHIDNKAHERPLLSSESMVQMNKDSVKSIFDKGLVDKHGIEVVSVASMVRRRDHGLTDPLN